MRIFVLTTGRSGSVTFSRACGFATNVTAEHESRAALHGPSRLDYPDDHIEVDNRLTWMLGPLAERFPDARYVHLRRDPEATAQSFLDRWTVHPPPPPPTDEQRRRRWQRRVRHPRASLASAWGNGILMRSRPWPEEERLDVTRHLVETMHANIRVFLADRPHVAVDLERAGEQLPGFWRWAGLEGDLDSAVAEFDTVHNATIGRDRPGG